MYYAVSVFFVISCVILGFSILLLGLKNLYGRRWFGKKDLFWVCICSVLAFEITGFFYQGLLYDFAAGAIICCGIIFVLQKVFDEYTAIGILFYFATFVLGIASVVWGLFFVYSVEVSSATRVLLLCTSPLLLLTLPFGYLQMVEQFDVLCRKQWKRPRNVRSERPGTRAQPMVSLHIPTYSEPPQIVIGTLNEVAKLNYDNYEVILIDNNTKDEALWRPVEAHCKKLGSKFRFFHVDHMSGAKAGALNFALKQTSAEAEIVGIIDSDYHPDPNFIADLIPSFEDPKIGFVQTPHDYRDWRHNLYLKMCYWEYKAFFHTILIALNERDAALTIGTMCLLRKRAILEAGGWALWCVTEDSELAIRIHDAGYSSIYIPTSYGWGLIPTTFADYATQRYRWIAGPVQELKHHIAHFFGLSGKSSRLSFSQRLHHFHHGFGSAMFSLNIPLTALSLLLVLSMAVHREIIPVPFPLWLSVTVLFLSSLFLQWLQYRVILQTSIKEMCLGLLARKALNYAVNTASLSTLITSDQKWKRTNKFESRQTILSSLSSTRHEFIIGIFLCAFAITMYSLQPFPGLLAMCLLGILYNGLGYLAAPLVALIAVRSQERPTAIYVQKQSV